MPLIPEPDHLAGVDIVDPHELHDIVVKPVTSSSCRNGDHHWVQEPAEAVEEAECVVVAVDDFEDFTDAFAVVGLIGEVRLSCA